MTTSTDRAIASLRDHHDRLASLVEGLSAEELDGPSAAEKWSIAQVLSHLGSGAEIFGPRYDAAVAGTAAPEVDNQAIWGRWDESSGPEQAAGFLEHDESFVARLESLSAEQRASLSVDLGFGPGPMPLENAVGLRLNEVAAHAWDVFAGLDSAALLDAEAADLLLEAYAGPSAYLLGWIGKPDRLSSPVVVAADGYTLTVDDGVTLATGVPEDGGTATLTAPREALLRLLLGRLKDGYTAPGVRVEGNATLDDLRQVFPGY